MTIDDLLTAGAPPVVAILRGIRPDQAVPVTRSLVDAGIRIVEVPFNSPEPLESIRRILAEFGDDALVGGGTVLTPQAADDLAAAGGQVMVTPNTDPAVIARAVERGMVPMPGFVTPSEAFRAHAAGARRIKLFPAVALGPAYLKAILEVLPKDTRVWAVGGTGAANLHEWLDAGAEGIGVGGALYKAGDGAEIVGKRAWALAEAWRNR